MRRAGIGALQAQQQRAQALAATGEKINEDLLKNMHSELEAFQKNLETFAIKHKKDIQKNPEFRAKFHQMCATVGVDPLTSRKGVWSEMLGVGDYYYELSVRAVEVCLATRNLNGGILEVSELIRMLEKSRHTFTEKISGDDVERAVKKLKVLGGGFDVIKLGKKTMIQSIPCDLNRDHVMVLQTAEELGHITASAAAKKLNWPFDRVKTAFDYLLNAEMAWVDDQGTEREYWILGLVKGSAGD